MTQPDMSQPDNSVPDKIDGHYRQQLSAMLDGALSPDEARFLLRRLQHDVELSECWERWQLCGDILRGQVNAPLPALLLPGNFALRVADAVAAESKAGTAASRSVKSGATKSGTTKTHGWMRWGGGAALAASVAVAALLVVRQTPNTSGPGASDPMEVVATSPAATPATGTLDAAAPAATDATTTKAAASLAPTVVAAVAEVPRRANVRGTRGQRASPVRRVATRTPARRIETPVALAVNAAASAATAVVSASTAASTKAAWQADAFVIRPVTPPRPWPRALLSDYPATGGFTVGHGTTVTTPSFQPFGQSNTPTATDTDAEPGVEDPAPY